MSMCVCMTGKAVATHLNNRTQQQTQESTADNPTDVELTPVTRADEVV